MQFLPASLSDFNQCQHTAVLNMDAQKAHSVSLAIREPDHDEYVFFLSTCGMAGFAVRGNYLAFIWKHPMSSLGGDTIIPAMIATIEQT